MLRRCYAFAFLAMCVAHEARDAPCQAEMTSNGGGGGGANFRSALGVDAPTFCSSFLRPRKAHVKSTPGHAYIGAYTQGNLSRSGLTASINQYTRLSLREAGLLREDNLTGNLTFHLRQLHRVNKVAAVLRQDCANFLGISSTSSIETWASSLPPASSPLPSPVRVLLPEPEESTSQSSFSGHVFLFQIEGADAKWALGANDEYLYATMTRGDVLYIPPASTLAGLKRTVSLISTNSDPASSTTLIAITLPVRMIIATMPIDRPPKWIFPVTAEPEHEARMFCEPVGCKDTALEKQLTALMTHAKLVSDIRLASEATLDRTSQMCVGMFTFWSGFDNTVTPLVAQHMTCWALIFGVLLSLLNYLCQVSRDNCVAIPTKETSENQAPHLSSIDALKGVAILATIHSHISLEGFTPPGHAHITLIQPHSLCAGTGAEVGMFMSPFSFLTSSRRGVSVLFAINGFLLTLPYMSGKRPLPSSVPDIIAFWRRRLGRLVPLFHLRLLLSLAIRPLQHDFFNFDFLRQMFLLFTLSFPLTQDMFAPHLAASNGHVSFSFLWTLGVTVTFIMMFPLLIICFVRAPKSFFVCACVLSVGTRTYALGSDPLTSLASFYHIPTTQLFRDSLCGRLEDFAVGMVTASVYNHRKTALKRISLLWFWALASGFWILACQSWEWMNLKLLPDYCSVMMYSQLTISAALLILAALLTEEKCVSIMKERHATKTSSGAARPGRAQEVRAFLEYLLHSAFSVSCSVLGWFGRRSFSLFLFHTDAVDSLLLKHMPHDTVPVYSMRVVCYLALVSSISAYLE